MTAAALTGPSPVLTEPSLCVAAGRVLTLAGTVFGLSNLFQYGVQSGGLHLHPAVLSLSWPIAIAAFFIILARLRRVGGETARRVAGWSRAAIGLTIATALGLLAVSLLTRDFAFMYWMTPVGLGVYAVAWTTASVRGKRAWMLAPALGALCAAALAASQLGSPEQYLTYAAGLFAFVLIPGAWLASGRTA